MRKKRSLKAFSLIEVLVAMAILGVCSLLLVSMYASVSMRMRSNNQINDRMSEQQKYVETKTQLSATNNKLFDVSVDSSLAGNTAYIGADNTQTHKFEIYCIKNNANPSWVGSDKASSKNFVVNCAVYTLKNVEDGEPVAEANDKDDLQVDFKYFVGDNYMQ